MNTILKLFLLFIAATILHWALMAFLGGVGVSLNVMSVFAVAVCAYLKPEYGYPLSFVCGLFLDFFSVKLFGCSALTLTLCAAAVYSLEKRLDFDGILPQIISVFCLSLLAFLLNCLLLKIVAGFSAWRVVGSFACGIILNAFLAPFLFRVVRIAFVRGNKSY